nr:disease resistance protein Roq1-like [Ziziphus jujuba var. spinosa]
MSGLGKTTVAKIVYDMICDQYEACSFVANVRELSQSLGLVALQEHLLSELLLGKKISIQDVQEGIALLRYWIRNKRVLIILDDADGLDQLNALAGNPDWFGIGSRIIITSRNESLLHDHGVKHMYLCESLHDDEALKLLSFNAFKQNHPIKGFEKMCSHVVKYAHGIPLILKVLGSFLCGKGRNQWIQTLGALASLPQQTGFNIIRIGFDSLQETEKDIFLHIACFFKGKQIDRVVPVLDCSLGFFTKIVIKVLIDKSLVYISNNILCMHSFVQEIGREIVRQECTSDPGKRSRLWHHEDINDVMMGNLGTEVIEAIVLDIPELECYWNPRCFSGLDNLRLLSIRSVVHLPQGLIHLPKNLRFLKWREYPLKFLPSNFYPPLLVELNMCYSQILQLWNGEKFLRCLKFIKLSHSWNLIKTPDFTGVPNLERLVLEDCRNLIEVHPSIGILKRLHLVNMRDCTSVTNLPSAISMECLESYVLSGCSKLEKFPDIVGPMQYLSQPNLDRTAINNLPKSIEHLAGLASINRRNCNYLSCLLSGMPNLRKLDLRDCNLPEGAIPSNIGCLTTLEVLDLSRNKFLTLPPSISQLIKLKFLGLAYCNLLESVPELPANITCVEARDCSSLVTFSKPICLFTSTELVLSFINCYQLTDGCKSMAITWLKAYLRSILNTQNQELSHRIGRFDAIIPGTRIPEWFRHQNIGSSITVQLSPNWRNDNWIGFVFFIAFGVHEHPFHEDEHLDSENSHEISCQLYTNEGPITTGFGFCISEGTMFKSDHLWLRYMSNESFKERMVWWNRINYLEVSFGTPSPCLDVKMCGFRVVYKQDMEEIKNKKFNYNRPPLEDLGIQFFSFDA